MKHRRPNLRTVPTHLWPFHSHLLHIWSTRLHKHSTIHWILINHILGVKVLEAFHCSMFTKEGKHPDRSLTETDRRFHSYLPTLKFDWHLSWGGKSCPVVSHRRPSEENQNWHQPCDPSWHYQAEWGHPLTPDTSDLCHLICGTSEWQRGKWAACCCCCKSSGFSVGAVGTTFLPLTGRHEKEHFGSGTTSRWENKGW